MDKHLPHGGQRGRLVTGDSLGPDYQCRWCQGQLALVGPHPWVLVCMLCDTDLDDRLDRLEGGAA